MLKHLFIQKTFVNFCKIFFCYYFKLFWICKKFVRLHVLQMNIFFLQYIVNKGQSSELQASRGRFLRLFLDQTSLTFSQLFTNLFRSQFLHHMQCLLSILLNLFVYFNLFFKILDFNFLKLKISFFAERKITKFIGPKIEREIDYNHWIKHKFKFTK
jgi:hypothetical protein